MKIALVLFLTFVSLYAQADWCTSYEEAKKQAYKDNKSVLIMLSKEGCDACWYMENIVFEDTKVNALVKENFIPVYMDVNEEEVPSIFKFVGTPTFYFTDANGSKLGHRINGAKNVKEFTQRVNEVLKEVKKKP